MTAAVHEGYLDLQTTAEQNGGLDAELSALQRFRDLGRGLSQIDGRERTCARLQEHESSALCQAMFRHWWPHSDELRRLHGAHIG